VKKLPGEMAFKTRYKTRDHQEKRKRTWLLRNKKQISLKNSQSTNHKTANNS
jgi:hypothetical protein